jgi:hypothetical protein
MASSEAGQCVTATPPRASASVVDMNNHPRSEDYPTAWSYWQTRRNWRPSHGGSLLALLAIALVFGGLGGSTSAVFALMAFAVVAWVFARSRP